MEPYLYIILIILFLLIGFFATTGVKSQFVRIIDVLLFGPFLIWLATQIENVWIKIILLFMGTTTIAYNARNWWFHENQTKNNFTTKPIIKNTSISHPASW